MEFIIGIVILTLIWTPIGVYCSKDIRKTKIRKPNPVKHHPRFPAEVDRLLEMDPN